MMAAVFTATGQDIASVHENSWSVFDISAEEEIQIKTTESGKITGLTRYGLVIQQNKPSGWKCANHGKTFEWPPLLDILVHCIPDS